MLSSGDLHELAYPLQWSIYWGLLDAPTLVHFAYSLIRVQLLFYHCCPKTVCLCSKKSWLAKSVAGTDKATNQHCILLLGLSDPFSHIFFVTLFSWSHTVVVCRHCADFISAASTSTFCPFSLLFSFSLSHCELCQHTHTHTHTITDHCSVQ